jgi:hypothetical protein
MTRFLRLAAAILALCAAPAGSRAGGRVVVFVADASTLSDLADYGGPNIKRIMSEGSIGLMNNRGATGRSGPTSALSINSMAKAAGDASACAMMSADEPIGRGRVTAAEVFVQRTRVVPEGVGILDIGLPKALAALAGTPAEGRLGLLGDALRQRGLLTSAIGCSDCPGEATYNESVRWSAAIAMSSAGTVDSGDVSRRMLAADSGSPFGVRTDPGQVLAWLDLLLADERVALVVVDSGDTYRAYVHSRYALEAVAASQKAEAVAAADALLGAVLARLDPASDTLLLLALAPPADAGMEMVPLVAWGSGFGRGGVLWSPGTRQEGLVTAPDLGATLAFLTTGSVPPGAEGFPIESRRARLLLRAGQANPHLRGLLAACSIGPAIDGWARSTMLGILVVVWALGFVLLAAWAAAKRAGAGFLWAGRALVVWASILAAALFWVNGILNAAAAAIASSAVFVALLWAWTLGLSTLLTIAFLRVWPKTTLRVFSLVAGAWILALVGEVVLRGSPFDSGTVLGYSPYFGGRFYGIGNIAMVLLVGGALSYMAVQRPGAGTEGRPGPYLVGWWIVFFAVVLFVIAAPQLGANIGGGIGAAVGFAGAVWVYSGRQLRAKHVWLALLLLIVCLAALAAVELARPDSSKGHFGRFLLDIQRNGFAPAADLFETKVRLWARAFKHATWDFAFVGALASYAFVWARRRERLKPILRDLPAMNAALIGAILAASVAFFVNDSGPIVPVLLAASVFGPFLCHSLPLTR